MRLFVFGCRPYDEDEIFRRLALECHREISCTPEQLTMDNLEYYIPMLRGPQGGLRGGNAHQPGDAGGYARGRGSAPQHPHHRL